MKKITTYYYNDETFYILYDEKQFLYFAIDKKFVGVDGKMIRQINGIEGHADKDMSKCIELARQSVDAKYFKNQGYSDIQAVCLAVLGYVPETAKGL